MSESGTPQRPADEQPIFPASQPALSPTLSQALNSRGIYRPDNPDNSASADAVANTAPDIEANPGLAPTSEPAAEPEFEPALPIASAPIPTPTSDPAPTELPAELLAEIFPSSFAPVPAATPKPAPTPEPFAQPAPEQQAQPALEQTVVPSYESTLSSQAEPGIESEPAPAPTAPSLNEALQQLSARAIANAETGGAGIPLIPGERIAQLPELELEDFTPFVPVFAPSAQSPTPATPASGYAPVEPPYTGGITVSPISSIVKQPDDEQHWVNPLTALSAEPVQPYIPSVAPSPNSENRPRTQELPEIPALAFTKQTPSQKIQSAHNASSLPSNIFAPVNASPAAIAPVATTAAIAHQKPTANSKARGSSLIYWLGGIVAIAALATIYYLFIK